MTDLTDNEHRASKQGSRIARTDKGVALALDQHTQTRRHRRILFGAHDTNGVILHGDDLLGRNDLKSRQICSLLCGNSANSTLITDQRVFRAQIFIFFSSCQRAQHGLARRVVAAHDINNDSHM